jgi:hypothetical protein
VLAGLSRLLAAEIANRLALLVSIDAQEEELTLGDVVLSHSFEGPLL